MLNLHDIVRGAITALHPDEAVTLFQSTGQENVRGRIQPTYGEGQAVQAQIQGNGGNALTQSEAVSTTMYERKAYLYAPDEALPPDGINRPLARTGDVLLRANGTWWLVTSVLDAFAKSGWMCVGITEQVEKPAGIVLPDTDASDTDTAAGADND